jgi:MoaA/NifB/PqqE/SkfB family radical SAM enzyme
MCNCWHENNDYLSKADIIGFIQDLYDWRGSNLVLQIAGGEPLIFKGIFEIFKFCSVRSITTKITTNGFGLNKSACDKIIESGLPFISISIDSHIPAVHDKFRGRSGLYRNAIEGLQYLRKNSKIVIGISSIIMRENISHLKDFTNFLLDLGVDRILFQPIADYYNPIDQWTSYEYWINDFEALDRGIDYLLEKKKESPTLFNSPEDFELIRNYFKDPYSIINQRACHLGYEQLFVDDRGEITLCNDYASIGNIKNRDISKVWHASKSMAERKQMVDCNLPCTSNCKKEPSLPEKVTKFVKLYRSGLFR